MREPSIYFSPTFYPQIWQDFSHSFKSKGAKSDYFMLCCDICDFAGKDFLALTDMTRRLTLIFCSPAR